MSQLLRISILLNLGLALGAAWLLRPVSPATEVVQSGHAEKATVVASKPVEEATNIVSPDGRGVDPIAGLIIF